MKDNSIYTERYKGYTIKIYQDPCPENPREAWDNFGHMICFHSRYLLGDKHTWEKVMKTKEKMNQYDLKLIEKIRGKKSS